MFKELSLLALLLGYAAAQNPMALMMYRQLLGGGGGETGTGSAAGAQSGFGSTGGAFGAAGAAGARGSRGSRGMFGGMGNMLGRIMNNPMLLCRQTEGFQAVPCNSRFQLFRGMDMCQLMSMRTYNFPGLMKCSPLGFGCCVKDFTSLWLANALN